MDSETIEKFFNDPKIIVLNKPDIYFLDIYFYQEKILLFSYDEYKQHLIKDTLIASKHFLDSLISQLIINNLKPEILEISIDNIDYYVVYSEISNTDYCLWRLSHD
jgi:hypothetical protein